MGPAWWWGAPEAPRERHRCGAGSCPGLCSRLLLGQFLPECQPDSEQPGLVGSPPFLETPRLHQEQWCIPQNHCLVFCRFWKLSSLTGQVTDGTRALGRTQVQHGGPLTAVWRVPGGRRYGLGWCRWGHGAQSAVSWEPRSVRGTRASSEPGPGWGLGALWPSGRSVSPAAGEGGDHTCVAGQWGKEPSVPFTGTRWLSRVVLGVGRSLSRVVTLSSVLLCAAPRPKPGWTGRRLWAHPGPTPFPRGTPGSVLLGHMAGSPGDRWRPPWSPDPFPSQDHPGLASEPDRLGFSSPPACYSVQQAGLPLGLRNAGQWPEGRASFLHLREWSARAPARRSLHAGARGAESLAHLPGDPGLGPSSGLSLVQTRTLTGTEAISKEAGGAGLGSSSCVSTWPAAGEGAAVLR